MTAPMSSDASSDIPDGMRTDARETWPSRELIDSFLGTGFDFELRLGEDNPTPIHDPQRPARCVLPAQDAPRVADDAPGGVLLRQLPRCRPEAHLQRDGDQGRREVP